MTSLEGWGSTIELHPHEVRGVQDATSAGRRANSTRRRHPHVVDRAARITRRYSTTLRPIRTSASSTSVVSAETYGTSGSSRTTTPAAVSRVHDTNPNIAH